MSDDEGKTAMQREYLATKADLARLQQEMAAADQRLAILLDSPVGRSLRIAELRERVVALEGEGKFAEAAPLKSEWIRLTR